MKKILFINIVFAVLMISSYRADAIITTDLIWQTTNVTDSYTDNNFDTFNNAWYKFTPVENVISIDWIGDGIMNTTENGIQWVHFYFNVPINGWINYRQIGYPSGGTYYELTASGDVTFGSPVDISGVYLHTNGNPTENTYQNVNGDMIRLTSLEDGEPDGRIPEPSTMLLLGAGLLGAGVLKWRKKR